MDANATIRTTPLYRKLASLCDARLRCLQRGSEWAGATEWADKHESEIERIVADNMPSGSGIDNGMQIDLDASNGERLVFTFGYHHMNDGGFYDGWTEHKLTVKPSLQFGIELRISGRDRNQVKDYLHECMQHALTQEIAD